MMFNSQTSCGYGTSSFVHKWWNS